MRINDLHILARDLEAQRRFYVDTLGFALESSTPIEFTVRAGASRLRLIDQTSARSAFGPYHFAFNIPFDQVEAAKAWTAARSWCAARPRASRPTGGSTTSLT